MDLDKVIEVVKGYLLDYGMQLIAAIAIWIIGVWIINKILKMVGKVMTGRNYDVSLQKFLINLLGWILKALLIIAILSKVGIETTSFAAVLAAAGLAVGMALQGSLGNFAGGVLLMIFKPFKIGDLIEAQGEHGVVKDIEIFTTKLTTLDSKEVIIPNGPLSNGNIINYTAEGKIRVDLVFGVSYDADIKQTKEVLMRVLKDNSKVITYPEPTVSVCELADSSVNFAVRPWCGPEYYWDVYFEVTEAVKIALDEAGIEIPYPHQVEIEKQG